MDFEQLAKIENESERVTEPTIYSTRMQGSIIPKPHELNF